MIVKSRTLAFVKYLDLKSFVFQNKVLVSKRVAKNGITNTVFGKNKVLNHYGRHHGRGFIAGRGEGIVTVGGTPAARRILLFERGRFVLVRSIWSKADGTYLFDRLNESMEYMVVAVDHKKQYEPVAYDFVRPALPESG